MLGPEPGLEHCRDDSAKGRAGEDCPVCRDRHGKVGWGGQCEAGGDSEGVFTGPMCCPGPGVLRAMDSGSTSGSIPGNMETVVTRPCPWPRTLSLFLQGDTQQVVKHLLTQVNKWLNGVLLIRPMNGING